MEFIGFSKLVVSGILSLFFGINVVGNPNMPIYKKDTVYVPILMYHQVAPKIGDSPYYVEPDMLDQQMAWLRDNNYNVISYEQFYRGVYGDGELPLRPVVLTFDDGVLNHYTEAFPILQKYGYTGTFFIITNAVGVRNYMNWEMLNKMVKAGMNIESHTVTHANLTELNEEEMEFQLVKSKQVLEEKLGITVKYLAYPGGANGKLSLRELPEAGYVSAATTYHTVYHKKDGSPFTVGRMHIDSDMESFVGFVTGRRRF